MFFCTMHCNIIIPYKATKCTFSKLISLIYVFYMFSTQEFIYMKTVVCTAMV